MPNSSFANTNLNTVNSKRQKILSNEVTREDDTVLLPEVRSLKSTSHQVKIEGVTGQSLSKPQVLNVRFQSVKPGKSPNLIDFKDDEKRKTYMNIAAEVQAKGHSDPDPRKLKSNAISTMQNSDIGITPKPNISSPD